MKAQAYNPAPVATTPDIKVIVIIDTIRVKMNLLGLPGLPEFSEKQICILLSKHSHRYTG